MSYGRPPPRIEGMVSLKVDNLTYRTTPEDLRRVFERCGEVGDIYIPRDRFSRESRGFAFVRFYDKRDAEDALDAMDGRLLDGRELRVQMARYGRPSSPYRRHSRRRRLVYSNSSLPYYYSQTFLESLLSLLLVLCWKCSVLHDSNFLWFFLRDCCNTIFLSCILLPNHAYSYFRNFCYSLCIFRFFIDGFVTMKYCSPPGCCENVWAFWCISEQQSRCEKMLSCLTYEQ
ncbi:hypothetical protein B7P43_G15117 [Cryptotermes secundus]|uniref:Serine/arginine-rich splicing factor 2 n=1 Tax=Cryptotermes secundus TaxID=105785 RepID=A0A2J7QE97_9NEOP|nr:hypothetical protein B7P43_G15117 [Cryptotermes secundus]